MEIGADSVTRVGALYTGSVRPRSECAKEASAVRSAGEMVGSHHGSIIPLTASLSNQCLMEAQTTHENGYV